MQSLSVTAAWNETRAFVAREAALLAPIAILFVALPVILMNRALPDPSQETMAWTPGLAWLVLLMAVATAFGTLTISTMALRTGISVGEALRHGARRILPMLGASFLLALAFFFLVMLLAVVTAFGGSEPTPQSAALVILLISPIAFALAPRLLLMAPVAADEGVGPIGIIRRSWALTRGHWGKMIGFLLLVGIAVLVLSGAVSVITGLIARLILGPLDPGSPAEFTVLVVSGLFGALVTVYYQVLVARIYVQLAGSPNNGI